MTKEFGDWLVAKRESIPATPTNTKRVKNPLKLRNMTISQVQMADVIEFPRIKYVEVEDGQHNLKPEFAVKLCERHPSIKPHERATVYLLASGYSHSEIDQLLNFPDTFTLFNVPLTLVASHVDNGAPEELKQELSISFRLKSMRTSLGLTRSSMAERIGVNPRTYINNEQGVNHISEENIPKYLEAFNIEREGEVAFRLINIGFELAHVVDALTLHENQRGVIFSQE